MGEGKKKGKKKNVLKTIFIHPYFLTIPIYVQLLVFHFALNQTDFLVSVKYFKLIAR